MIKNFCEKTLTELSRYHGNDKEELFLNYLNERLDKSFESYVEELDSSLAYLKRRNELNVARKMNRLK